MSHTKTTHGGKLHSLTRRGVFNSSQALLYLTPMHCGSEFPSEVLHLHDRGIAFDSPH